LSKDPALQDTSDVIPLDRGHPGSVSPFVQAPDTLLECLLVVVHAHGGTLSRQAAIDGLPLVNNRLTPSLFRRAAKRAGFTSNVVRKPLDQLNPALFPAVLLLDGEEACVLLGWKDDGQTARLVFPELGEAEASLTRDELAARYSALRSLRGPVPLETRSRSRPRQTASLVLGHPGRQPAALPGRDAGGVHDQPVAIAMPLMP
jgi:ABC-type bacteriocin/lantibiotic exporter with double-glycine peptidase domain